MNKLFDKIAADIARDLKNISVAFRIHLAIFIITFFIFGVLGIIPLFTILKTKLFLVEEMHHNYDTMISNLANLEEAERLMALHQNDLLLLDIYMPADTTIQDYMLDFIQVVGQNDHIVKGFSQDPSINQTGQIDFNVALEGSTYPVNLLKDIESIKRVTQIKNLVLYRDDDGVMSTSLFLTIYTLLK